MNKEKLKILLAEDDLNLGILLVDYLETEGFEVKLCKDGDMALKAFEQQNFDLCLLDIMMPKRDGLSLAKLFKAQKKDIPLIFISAKALKEDKLEAYSIGADDYLTKPFDEEELLWKIKALVRRLPKAESLAHANSINLGIYCFEPAKQLLSMANSQKRITEKESEILLYLWQHRNSLIKREDMLQALWGNNDYFLGRSLDVFITKIRKYLKADDRLSIENVFGVGFIFNVPLT